MGEGADITDRKRDWSVSRSGSRQVKKDAEKRRNLVLKQNVPDKKEDFPSRPEPKG